MREEAERSTSAVVQKQCPHGLFSFWVLHPPRIFQLQRLVRTRRLPLTPKKAHHRTRLWGPVPPASKARRIQSPSAGSLEGSEHREAGLTKVSSEAGWCYLIRIPLARAHTSPRVALRPGFYAELPSPFSSFVAHLTPARFLRRSRSGTYTPPRCDCASHSTSCFCPPSPLLFSSRNETAAGDSSQALPVDDAVPAPKLSLKLGTHARLSYYQKSNAEFCCCLLA